VHAQEVDFDCLDQRAFNHDLSRRTRNEALDVVLLVEPYVLKLLVFWHAEVLPQKLFGLVESEAGFIVFHLVFLQQVLEGF